LRRNFTAWLGRKEREILAYVIEEIQVLRRQLGGQCLRLTDHDRRQLAARAYRIGRQTLREVATIVTLGTLLCWHQQRQIGNDAPPVFSRKSAG
jgi:hypothetical protein